jgi:alginate O-acetyltransferase complex protein AlgI
MLFNSIAFMFGFLPVCLLGFALLVRLGRPELALNWLTLMSLVFYSQWNPAYLPLIIGSMILNFGFARRIAAAPGRRGWLSAGVAANLALLGLFKYADFAVGNANRLPGIELPLPDIALPLAISFFTFQQIGLLVDVSRLRIAPPGPRDHLLFVTFFPQLIAGPIVHLREMMPQLARRARQAFNGPRAAAGFTLFLIGLFKKVVIADSIGRWATPVFSAAEAGQTLAPAELWIGTLAYTLQIYFDFSGYCDMAIGLANLFGVRLPVNFHSPYQARSIVEFWRRWHMTLSRFLRDYLYIPLGGNRRGNPVANLMLTMVLGGLWHGANWTFVAWGALHGIYLAVNHGWRRIASGVRLPSSARRLLGFAGWALTLLCVIVAWVLFRSDSLDAATRMLLTMFHLQPAPALGWRFGVLALLLLSIWLPNALELTHGQRLGLPVPSQLRRRWAERLGAAIPLRAIRLAIYAGFVVFFVAAGPKPPSEFLYFNF